MPAYIISYDLRNKRDYDDLYEAIKAYGTWAHILESTWAVVTRQSAGEILDDLRQHMDSDDGLFVVRSGGEAAWVNVECETSWLKDQLPKTG